MIRTFSEAVSFVEAHIASQFKYPGERGIERMLQLLALIDNPHRSFAAIHVGGTSGKGSTSTVISALLSQTYTVGLNLSPHLERITERVQVNGTEISETDFTKLIRYLADPIQQMEKSNEESPSYFEILTAIAFLYFQEKKVDCAVIEVGMGGMYDATNVITPSVSVFTNVGLDHTPILGNTVETIAREKAGIIKHAIPVISGVSQPSVLGILEDACRRINAPLFLYGRDFHTRIQKVTKNGSIFDYNGIHSYYNLHISLLGAHQVANAALALRAVEAYEQNRKNSTTLPEEKIRRAIATAFIPGRLEIVRKHPIVILDGAHNSDKARALADAITTLFPCRRIRLVLAIKQGKQAREMLKIILPLCSDVILTSFSLMQDMGQTQSYDPNELIREVSSIDPEKRVTVIPLSSEAVACALQKAQPEDVVLVTGSLYLVGEVRKRILGVE